MTAAPFDNMAADYDDTFSDTLIGRQMRALTWRRIDGAFQLGDLVLELNCGTGEDALHLARRGVRVVATDASSEMLAITRAKADLAGLADLITIERMSIEALGDRGPGDQFDGVLSNFGGLNCVEDLPAVAAGLAKIVRPRGRVLLCIMGPMVPWEWAWFLAHRSPRQAFRRARRRGTQWRGLRIRYHSIGQTRRAFAPHFVQRRVAAIGALAPPPFAEEWARSHPKWLAALDRCERRLETLWPLPWLADHYLIELERQ